MIQNKVVAAGLKDLTLCVNMSTGIAHPSDRDATIHLFEILKRGGEIYDPEDVKAWLVAEEGWKAADAQDVADLARDILNGKKPRLRSPFWNENILEKWRRDAREL